MSIGDDTSRAAWETIATVPPIQVGPEDGSRTVLVEIKDCNGPDWFPAHFRCGRLDVELILRRSELRALRDRLDEIDRAQPEPGERHRRTPYEVIRSR